MPCSNCAAKATECIFDPRTDRRRRVHRLELSQLHHVLYSTVAELQQGNPDQIKSLVLALRSFAAPQEAVRYLIQKYKN